MVRDRCVVVPRGKGEVLQDVTVVGRLDVQGQSQVFREVRREPALAVANDVGVVERDRP